MPQGQHIGAVALLVRDYDEAITYYVGVLGFELIEDMALDEVKRGCLLRRADRARCVSCWPMQRRLNKSLEWGINQVAECFCFFIPMISGETITG